MKHKSNITPAYLRTRDAATYMGVSKFTLEMMRSSRQAPGSLGVTVSFSTGSPTLMNG